MLATTILGAATGVGGSYVVLDDPHKTKEESGSKEIEAQVRAYGDTFATRLDDKKQGAIVIVMQRFNDMTSPHVMKTVEEHYVHLKIDATSDAAMYPRPYGRVHFVCYSANPCSHNEILAAVLKLS